MQDESDIWIYIAVAIVILSILVIFTGVLWLRRRRRLYLQRFRNAYNESKLQRDESSYGTRSKVYSGLNGEFWEAVSGGGDVDSRLSRPKEGVIDMSPVLSNRSSYAWHEDPYWALRKGLATPSHLSLGSALAQHPPLPTQHSGRYSLPSAPNPAYSPPRSRREAQPTSPPGSRPRIQTPTGFTGLSPMPPPRDSAAVSPAVMSPAVMSPHSGTSLRRTKSTTSNVLSRIASHSTDSSKLARSNSYLSRRSTSSYIKAIHRKSKTIVKVPPRPPSLVSDYKSETGVPYDDVTAAYITAPLPPPSVGSSPASPLSVPLQANHVRDSYATTSDGATDLERFSAAHPRTSDNYSTSYWDAAELQRRRDLHRRANSIAETVLSTTTYSTTVSTVLGFTEDDTEMQWTLEKGRWVGQQNQRLAPRDQNGSVSADESGNSITVSVPRHQFWRSQWSETPPPMPPLPRLGSLKRLHLRAKDLAPLKIKASPQRSESPVLHEPGSKAGKDDSDDGRALSTGTLLTSGGVLLSDSEGDGEENVERGSHSDEPEENTERDVSVHVAEKRTIQGYYPKLDFRVYPHDGSDGGVPILSRSSSRCVQVGPSRRGTQKEAQNPSGTTVDGDQKQGE